MISPLVWVVICIVSVALGALWYVIHQMGKESDTQDIMDQDL